MVWKTQLRIVQRRCGKQDGAGILRFRLSHLQFNPAEYMRMPAADAKHVFIIREALDIS